MKKILVSACALLMSSALFSQEKLEDQLLFTVENDTVTAGEYMAVYNKNRNIGEDIDPKTPSEYLDLYINFKLKVHEAKALGRDTIPSFVREYSGYRDQLARPYLTDRDVTQEIIKEAYERTKYDVRASHIMIAVADGASPKDTAEAHKTIMNIKAQLDKGAPFDKLAEEYSADKYSAERGGDLGYFTAFGMVYPFESAAYRSDVGEVSGPVRTRFGYHLIKVTDKRAARGEVQVAHVMLIANEKSTPEQSQQAEEKIQEIYNELKAGADFETLARQYSEDKSTSKSGGVMQPFGINKMFPVFEEAAYSIENPDEIAEPIKTPVGWHIIKLVSRQTPKTFEESKPMIKNRVDRDSRAQQGKMSIIKKLKREYNFREYPKMIQSVMSQVGEEFLNGKYEVKNMKNGDKTLFEFAKKQYTVANFLHHLDTGTFVITSNKSRESEIEKAYRTYVDDKLMTYEKSRLEAKYPEFRLLSREYFEGILLFDLTEEKVWQKSVKDSAGLQKFYAENLENYRWKERYQAYIVDGADAKMVKKALKMLKKRKTVQEVEDAMNEDSQLNVKVDSSVYESGSSEIIEMTPKFEGNSEIFEKDGRFFAVRILKVIPAAGKSFEEARGAIISDYQEYLEQQWISELKSEYEVKVNREVLRKTIAELESQS